MKRRRRHVRSRARRPKSAPGDLFARDTSGERFALTPSSAGEADRPGMTEWRVRQKQKAEADRLREQLGIFQERRK